MQGPRPRNRRRGPWRGYECVRMGIGHGQAPIVRANLVLLSGRTEANSYPQAT